MPCRDDGWAQKACPAEAADASETDSASDSAATESPASADGSASASASASESGSAHDASATGASATQGDETGPGADETGGTPDDEEEFDPGALIIPMDTDTQDEGMLRAYGLVYELLREGITIRWVIRPGKDVGDVDFTASAVEVATGEVFDDHGYRGGPWVVTAQEAAIALPIVESWQAEFPETAVHEVTAPFIGHVARRYGGAPTIAIFADGNEDIARKYLLAAGIPDSNGDRTWPDDSPDLLSVAEVSGPSDTDHRDGALFDAAGEPLYCQLMSMHWDVSSAEANPEVVAEVREFLAHDTHFFAECQAVNAFENLVPHGHFLTPNGFEITGAVAAYDFMRSDSPFAQMDGPFESVGGSEPSYSLPAGDAYYQSDTVIITEAGTPEGVSDVWMTGFLDGACAPDEHECEGAGKISYLGGHAYDDALPMSQNATTQGARLFLNSLFEAPCAFQH